MSGTTNVNGILSTSDSGATWQRVDIPVFASGYEACVHPSRGIVPQS